MNCNRRGLTYWTTCHCEPCTRDRARKRKLASMGRNHRPVSHNEAWTIVANKFDAGWTALALSSAVGLDDGYFSRHLARWRRGEQCLIGPTLAVAIVNMGRPTRGQVGAEPSRRRLRALATMGHGLNSLVIETGVSFSTLAAIRNGNQRVGAANANAITDTYARLHMVAGDDEQARRIAREKSWASPLSWDDIEDLAEIPTGAYRATGRADMLREYVDRGDNLTMVCRALGLTVNTLNSWCCHNGHSDLYRTLASREGDWNSGGRLSREYVA